MAGNFRARMSPRFCLLYVAPRISSKSLIKSHPNNITPQKYLLRDTFSVFASFPAKSFLSFLFWIFPFFSSTESTNYTILGHLDRAASRSDSFNSVLDSNIPTPSSSRLASVTPQVSSNKFYILSKKVQPISSRNLISDGMSELIRRPEFVMRVSHQLHFN